MIDPTTYWPILLLDEKRKDQYKVLTMNQKAWLGEIFNTGLKELEEMLSASPAKTCIKKVVDEYLDAPNKDSFPMPDWKRISSTYRKAHPEIYTPTSSSRAL